MTRASARTIGFPAGSAAEGRPLASFTPAAIRKTAKTYAVHAAAPSSADPATMKTTRSASAAPIAQPTAHGRTCAGTANADRATTNTNTLSSERLRSIA